MRGSIPNIAFVKRDIMPFQKCPIFVLEGNRFVMRLLIGHVSGDRLTALAEEGLLAFGQVDGEDALD